MRIDSKDNPRFKTWLSLLESAGIRKAGLALASGGRIVNELIHHPKVRDLVEAVLLPPSSEKLPSAARQFELSDQLYERLDEYGTGSPLLVIKKPAIENWSSGDPLPEGLVVVAATSDPANLGALIRSAHAFSASAVILTKECASAFLPKTIRASSGSSFKVPLFSGPRLSELRFPPSHAPVMLDLKGKDLSEHKWLKNSAVVVGQEGQGVPESLVGERLHIRMSDNLESLNVAVAASIALYSYANQK